MVPRVFIVSSEMSWTSPRMSNTSVPRVVVTQSTPVSRLNLGRSVSLCRIRGCVSMAVSGISH